MAINLVVGGDSMASNFRSGIPLGQGISGYLKTQNPSWTTNAYSVDGLQLEGMISTFTAQIHNVYYNPSALNIYVPFSLAHGNCQDTSQTAAQVYQLQRDLVALAKGLGWKTLSLTVPGTTEFNDPNASPYKRPVRQAYNALLRADWAGADWGVDVDTLPGVCTLCVPDSGPANSTYYLNDTPAFGAIHWTPFSNQQAATAIGAKINGINMATINKRLFGPAALTTSAATKYTAPGSTATVVKHIHVSNPVGNGAQSFTLSIGNDAAGTRVFSTYPLADGASLDFWGPYTLAAAEVIQALASSANVVMTIDGTETS